ncbi:MAG TPA: DUF58 domain-containing protein [Bacillales bacterium]|nr:DUF58 domain-containing protein [Bacillales bacterium]
MTGLLPSSLMTRLSNYKLSSRGMIRSGQKGERRSRRIGTSLEFSDYRLYNPGDDPRQIDWNTYARTQKHYIKRFLDEQELTVNVFIDCTKSMAAKEHKWLRTRQLAAIFAQISLTGADRLAIYPITSATEPYPLTKGTALVHRVLSYIENVTVNETGEAFTPVFLHKVNSVRPNGLSIVISDLLENPDQLFQALKRLQAKRQEVRLVQLLLPEEADPDYAGDLKLTDVESGAERDVTMSRKVVEQYRRRFEQHTNEIESFCRRRGIGYLQLFSTDTLEEMVFSEFMAHGWII